jgi:hypothetical protein
MQDFHRHHHHHHHHHYHILLALTLVCKLLQNEIRLARRLLLLLRRLPAWHLPAFADKPQNPPPVLTRRRTGLVAAATKQRQHP